MPTTRTVWTVTPEAFDSLLFTLDADREKAGRLYENLRRKLLEFFEARGSWIPEDHADETIDRVMRRLSEGEEVDNLPGYCYGVAKFVWMEASRKMAKTPVHLDENIMSPVTEEYSFALETSRDSVERKLDCLEKCLGELADETRRFIIDYYREENGIKVERRKLIAAQLNTTMNALRLRASRLRRELGKCTDECVSRSIAKGEVE